MPFFRVSTMRIVTIQGVRVKFDDNQRAFVSKADLEALGRGSPLREAAIACIAGESRYVVQVLATGETEATGAARAPEPAPTRSPAARSCTPSLNRSIRSTIW